MVWPRCFRGIKHKGIKDIIILMYNNNNNNNSNNNNNERNNSYVSALCVLSDLTPRCVKNATDNNKGFFSSAIRWLFSFIIVHKRIWL